jgi:superfamily I DNA/RNA helicase
MPETTVVVGIAGSGKTETAMNLLEDRLRSGLKWHQVGYSSFSRSACLEAAQRASKLTGVDCDRLQKEGFFRTIHSSVLRLLGLDPKCILDHDSAEGRKFMTEVLGAPRGGETGTLSAKIDDALSWWDLQRSRLNRLRRIDEPVGVYKTSDHPDHPRSASVRPDFGVGARTFSNENTGFSDAPNYILPIGGIFNSESSLHAPIRETEITGDQTLACDKKWPYIQEKLRSGTGWRLGGGGSAGERKNGEIRPDCDKMRSFGEIVTKYETQKRVWGKLDFCDLLFKYAGIRVDENLEFQETYPEGSVPAEVDLWIVDEFQDCSSILDRCCQRLSEAAGELWLLGDVYQSVYGFSGSEWQIMRSRELQAKEEGKRVVLNRSWRNPEPVIEWGEDILRRDPQYESREPVSETGEGTTGLVEWKELVRLLPLLANSDTMVLSRTWFNLGKVTQFLDSAGIPWKSIQEKMKSRWESPVQIAFVLVMRDLRDGNRISESDWRRVTEELPQKMDGRELFVRGAKAKWKKIECSQEPKRTLDELEEWGAGPEFADFIRSERWRVDKVLLLDQAIDRFGIDCVRDPGLRLGSCHSAKGLGARNVFVLASSTEKASGAAVDFYEDLFLKYVAITRTRENYRLVVDQMDLARGKPMFWAAPQGFREFVDLPEGAFRERERHTDEDFEMGGEAAGSLDREVSRGDLRSEGSPGSDPFREGEVPRDRGEETRRKADSDAIDGAGEDSYDWISI